MNIVSFCDSAPGLKGVCWGEGWRWEQTARKAVAWGPPGEAQAPNRAGDGGHEDARWPKASQTMAMKQDSLHPGDSPPGRGAPGGPRPQEVKHPRLQHPPPVFGGLRGSQGSRQLETVMEWLRGQYRCQRRCLRVNVMLGDRPREPLNRSGRGQKSLHSCVLDLSFRLWPLVILNVLSKPSKAT